MENSNFKNLFQKQSPSFDPFLANFFSFAAGISGGVSAVLSISLGRIFKKFNSQLFNEMADAEALRGGIFCYWTTLSGTTTDGLTREILKIAGVTNYISRHVVGLGTGFLMIAGGSALSIHVKLLTKNQALANITISLIYFLCYKGFASFDEKQSNIIVKNLIPHEGSFDRLQEIFGNTEFNDETFIESLKEKKEDQKVSLESIGENTSNSSQTDQNIDSKSPNEPNSTSQELEKNNQNDTKSPKKPLTPVSQNKKVLLCDGPEDAEKYMKENPDHQYGEMVYMTVENKDQMVKSIQMVQNRNKILNNLFEATKSDCGKLSNETLQLGKKMKILTDENSSQKEKINSYDVKYKILETENAVQAKQIKKMEIQLTNLKNELKKNNVISSTDSENPQPLDNNQRTSTSKKEKKKRSNSESNLTGK